MCSLSNNIIISRFSYIYTLISYFQLPSAFKYFCPSNLFNIPSLNHIFNLICRLYSFDITFTLDTDVRIPSTTRFLIPYPMRYASLNQIQKVVFCYRSPMRHFCTKCYASDEQKGKELGKNVMTLGAKCQNRMYILIIMTHRID